MCKLGDEKSGMDNCAMASCLSEIKCSKIDCGDVRATEYIKKHSKLSGWTIFGPTAHK